MKLVKSRPKRRLLEIPDLRTDLYSRATSDGRCATFVGRFELLSSDGHELTPMLHIGDLTHVDITRLAVLFSLRYAE
jgi:hypothetical protein